MTLDEGLRDRPGLAEPWAIDNVVSVALDVIGDYEVGALSLREAVRQIVQAALGEPVLDARDSQNIDGTERLSLPFSQWRTHLR